jgi:hypothetical protein
VSDWRDDLPPIPNERIRAAAIREGARRVEARLRRQRMVLVGGASVAAVALIVVAASQLDLQMSDDDDSAGGTTATTAAGGTSAGTTGTEAPGSTAAPGTTAAPATTAAAGTTAGGAASTVPDYTTIGGPIAAQPPNLVTVTPVVVWEQPVSGPECGATLLTITFDPSSPPPKAAVVHWETSGVRDQAPMQITAIAGRRARATIGPFPAETLETGTNHEVLIYVTDREAFGDQIFRAPTVILRDCSP